MNNDTTIPAMEREWFQIALKTYFWTGVINAVFCCIAIGSLIEIKRIKDEALRIERQNLADMKIWEGYRREAIDERRQAEFAWYKVQDTLRKASEGQTPPK